MIDNRRLVCALFVLVALLLSPQPICGAERIVHLSVSGCDT